MDFHIIERLGGACRCATLFTFAVHFFHALFSVVTYLAWVRQKESHLARSIQQAYLSMTVVCCVAYFLGASVFYMWAWRFPEPEEIAKRRRVYGVIINAIFADLPMFVVETHIVWQERFASALFGFTYCLTCISLCYSLLRVWLFFMVRLIKFKMPTAARMGATYPALAGIAERDLEQLDYNNTVARARGGVSRATNNRAAVERHRSGEMTFADTNGSVGSTILLNRNAGSTYSDDASVGNRAGGGFLYTPAAGPPSAADRFSGNRVDAFYGPSPSSARSAYPPEIVDSPREPTGRGYYGRNVASAASRPIPFRI